MHARKLPKERGPCHNCIMLTKDLKAETDSAKNLEFVIFFRSVKFTNILPIFGNIFTIFAYVLVVVSTRKARDQAHGQFFPLYPAENTSISTYNAQAEPPLNNLSERGGQAMRNQWRQCLMPLAPPRMAGLGSTPMAPPPPTTTHPTSTDNSTTKNNSTRSTSPTSGTMKQHKHEKGRCAEAVHLSSDKGVLPEEL